MPQKTAKKKTGAKKTRKQSTKKTKTAAPASEDSEAAASGPAVSVAAQIDVTEVADAPATSEPVVKKTTRRKTVKKKSAKRKRKTSRSATEKPDATEPQAPPVQAEPPPASAAPTSATEPGEPHESDDSTKPGADVASTEPAGSESRSDGPDQEERRPAKRRRGTRGGRRRSKAARRAAAAGESEDSEAVEASPDATAKRSLPTSKERDREAPPSSRRGKVTLGEFDGDRNSLAGKGTRTMVIETAGGEECRIAVLNEGKLEQLFIERASSASHVGNIYKGRITNVESSIQAVFVDFGLAKNGFLHISDVQPQYFPDHTGENEEVGRKIPRHRRPPIQRCFRRGQEVIVQITKEGVGTKGPTLTSYLSIPGRFLVMMPGMNRHGVSRRIEDEEARRKMRDTLKELDLPPDMGFILRTAGVDQSKRELQRDLLYLMRLWRTVIERIKTQDSPAELYRESDLVTRTIRDIFTSDFTDLIIDDEEQARQAHEFLHLVMPRTKSSISTYPHREPLFHRLGIEEEIERINMRHVPLPSGGSLVIDSTEAMVAIDVNSGKFRSPDDAEETALRINVEAAEEICRQLRLRDLGGLVVCDFIDMRLDRNKRTVERAMRDALKKHKERARILRMSAFGLIEITRQRMGPSLKRNIYYDCPHCSGSGLVKMPESVTLDVMRTIQLAAHHEEVQKITISVASEVAFEILNNKRSVIDAIEKDTGKTIIITGDAGFVGDRIEVACEDTRGRAVLINPPPPEPRRGRHRGRRR